MRTPTLAPLAALLAALWVHPAHAERVVILKLDGDKKEAVHKQLVGAVKKGGEVTLVPTTQYMKLATKKKLAKKASSASTIAKVAPALKVDAVISGSVKGAKALTIEIHDASGKEVWSKNIGLAKGKLSPRDAKRLASAIAAAAAGTDGGQPPASAKVPEESESVAARTPTDAPPASPRSTDRADESQAAAPREHEPSPAEEPVAQAPTRRRVLNTDDSMTVSADDDREDPVFPPLVHVQLSGTSTWRSYCSRPGVQSCAEFDSLDPAEQAQRVGDKTRFTTNVPYAGFLGQVELYPFTVLRSAARGVNLMGSYSRGFAATKVTVTSPEGEQEAKQVLAVDSAYTVTLGYRYFFSFWDDEEDGYAGYVGMRGGLAGRAFDVDAEADVPLLGSNRRYPVAAFEVSLPLHLRFRLDLSASYFMNPGASGQALERYGESVRGSGFALEGGASGHIWGPLGYTFRARTSRYSDKFSGMGTQWLDGGAAEEVYTSAYWGLTANF